MQAVKILFCCSCPAVLLVGDIPLVTERQRDYKLRSTQAKDLRSRGKEVPDDSRADTFLFTSQHHHDTIIAQAPISVRDVGQVTWISSKWHVDGADDTTSETEFAQFFALTTVFQTLLEDLLQLLGRPREARRDDGGRLVAGFSPPGVPHSVQIPALSIHE